MAVVAVWGVISILANSIGCSPNTVLPKPGSGYCVPSVSLTICQHLSDLLRILWISHSHGAVEDMQLKILRYHYLL
jgi:hypothetical protein